MTCAAALHQQRPGGVGDPSPAAQGGLKLLKSCCAFAACACFSGNFLRAAQRACRHLSCWAWTSNFLTGGGAPGLSIYLEVLLYPCLHIMYLPCMYTQ
jgi:hypothetical protein